MAVQEIQTYVSRLMGVIKPISTDVSKENLRDTHAWKKIEEILESVSAHADKITILEALLQSQEFIAWIGSDSLDQAGSKFDPKTSVKLNKISLLREIVIEIKLSQHILTSAEADAAGIKASLKTALEKHISTFGQLNAQCVVKMSFAIPFLTPLAGILALGSAVHSQFSTRNYQLRSDFIDGLVEKLYGILSSEVTYTTLTLPGCRVGSLKQGEDETIPEHWLRAIDYFYMNGGTWGFDHNGSEDPFVSHHTPIWVGQCKLAIREAILEQPVEIQLAYYHKMIASTVSTDKDRYGRYPRVPTTSLGRFIQVQRERVNLKSVATATWDPRKAHSYTVPEFGRRGTYKDIFMRMKEVEDEFIIAYLREANSKIPEIICRALQSSIAQSTTEQQKSSIKMAPSSTFIQQKENYGAEPVKSHNNDTSENLFSHNDEAKIVCNL